MMLAHPEVPKPKHYTVWFHTMFEASSKARFDFFCFPEPFAKTKRPSCKFGLHEQIKINKSVACDWNSEALRMLVEALVLFLDHVSMSMSPAW